MSTGYCKEWPLVTDLLRASRCSVDQLFEPRQDSLRPPPATSRSRHLGWQRMELRSDCSDSAALKDEGEFSLRRSRLGPVAGWCSGPHIRSNHKVNAHLTSPQS